MNFMICLSLFCERHGPTSILCSQAFEQPFAVEEELRALSNESAQAGTCASCSMDLPESGMSCLRSSIRTPQKSTLYCVSSQYPATQQRYEAIRQACLRGLSCEYTKGDKPILFTDSSIGAVMAVVFSVGDDLSRGQLRKYAIMCLSENDKDLMHNWSIIAPRVTQIAQYLQKRSFETLAKANHDAPHGVVNNDRFIRRKDVNKPPRSLCTLVNDDKIFLEIHAEFCKILALVRL